MGLNAGDRLGPYEVVSAIGAGGMGEVYKARDTRLDRFVAVKVLPDHIAAREDSRARFEREARAVASLNHPNICVLHDIGPNYMVMELIEGETLAARLSKGAIPIEQAVALAIQIADGLDRAHRAGVTHRDVKPQNIMLTRDGVKVLDFGLAKSVASKPGPTEETLTAVLTTEGTIMGTPQYMAPEQFGGKEADARSDIWAFGAVLYEMVTGRKAFQGANYQSLVGAILAMDPAPMAVQPFTPAWLERLVRRCLAKDPEDRWQSMRDVVIELRTPPGEVVRPLPEGRGTVARWIAGVMALLAVGVSALYFTRKDPVAQVMKFQIQPPGSAPTQFLAISPDGRMLAFVAESGGSDKLWIRPMDSIEARSLDGTDGATWAFWSPDSAWLAFFARGQLSKIAVAGGPPQKLCDTGEGRGGTWNRDGVILFSASADSPILRISAAGGVPTPVTTVAKDGSFAHLYPTFLPDGEHFLFSGGYLGSLKGGAPVRILAERHNSLYAAPTVSGESGYLLFRRDDTLMAQRFDPASLKLSGDAISVADQVSGGRNLSYGVFSVSGTGSLVYSKGANQERQLSWFDRSGKRLGVAGKPGRYFYFTPALSPDEKGVAVSIRKSSGGSDIWVGDLSRDVLSRLTFRDGETVYPLWSPDGKNLVFGFRSFSASTDFYLKPFGGNGSEELLAHAGTNGAPREFSQDGKWLLYGNQSPTTGRDLWLLPLQGERKPVPYLQSRFNEYFASFSPDAKWVAYESDESGRPEVYVQSVPAGGAKYQISTAGGTLPAWRRDGKEIYYLSADRRLMAVPIRIGTTIEAGAPQSLFVLRGSQGFTPSRDGQRFLVVEPAGGGEAAAVPPVTVVLNWQEALKK